MFKLTKREQVIVAFLVGALVIGTAVRQWRARQAPRLASPAAPTVEGDR